MTTATYDSSCFEVRSLAQAKEIILTPEDGRATNDRWARETPYLADLMSTLNLTPRSLLLDFGCGIGRLSKELITRTGCRVIGVDISTSMRGLAEIHVESERFGVMHPAMLDAPEFSHRFTHAISVWALQHVLDLRLELNRIWRALVKDGSLFVVNDRRRVVPTNKGWVDDGNDTVSFLGERFATQSSGSLDPDIVTAALSSRSFWATLQRLDFPHAVESTGGH